VFGISAQPKTHVVQPRVPLMEIVSSPLQQGIIELPIYRRTTLVQAPDVAKRG